MNNQKFVITSLILIVLASVLTSLITVNFFTEPFLKGPEQEGTVEITGGILPVVDVIIIDSSVVFGISDTIQFTGVVPGGTYTTDIDPLSSSPYPFVIRNNGNVDAKIEIDERRSAVAITSGLFSDANSRLGYWVENAAPIAGEVGYDTLDDCASQGGWRRSADSCEFAFSPRCIIPIAGNRRTTAINKLKYLDNADEVFLHIFIKIANTEPGGIKNTIITLTGSQA